MRRRGEFNPKRQVRPVDKADRTMLNRLARVVKYGGNPEHKSDPGDFGLTPPATPKPDKTLCDLRAYERGGLRSPFCARESARASSAGRNGTDFPRIFGQSTSMTLHSRRNSRIQPQAFITGIPCLPRIHSPWKS